MKPLLALLCATATCATPFAQAAGARVALGDVPEYAFRSTLIRGKGEARLSDFRGQPVLVQFWNSKLWGATDDMMKVVLRVQLEHEADLQVILVEPRLQPAALERLLLEKGWLGTRAVWTTERPFDHGGSDPACVLLSCEGAVILKSPDLGQSYDRTYPNQFMDELDAAVAAESDRRHGLLPDAPPAVSKACDEFAEGKVARALTSVRTLAGQDPTATHALATFERQIAARLGQAEFFLGKGRIAEAEAILDPLAGELSLADDLARRLAGMREQLATATLKAEREADRALAKLEKTLFTDGSTDRTPVALKALAKRHEGTRRGAEAARLAALLQED